MYTSAIAQQLQLISYKIFDRLNWIELPHITPTSEPNEYINQFNMNVIEFVLSMEYDTRGWSHGLNINDFSTRWDNNELECIDIHVGRRTHTQNTQKHTCNKINRIANHW